MEKNETPKWYLARVTKVHPHLSYGFVKQQQVYIRKSWEEGKWIVYNGGYADRRLTTEQCKSCLECTRKNGRPMLAPNSTRI